MNEEGLKVLPESIHDWDEVKNADTPEVFWDQMKNLRSKIGTGLYKPGDDAGKEDWTKFSDKAIELSGTRLMPRPDLEDTEQQAALYAILGKPKEATGYEFEEVEGSSLVDEDKKFLQEIAFEANLTKAQLKAIDKKIRERQSIGAIEHQETVNTALKTLRQEWGLTFDDRQNSAKKVMSTFFPHLDKDTELTAHELTAFHSLAKQLGNGNPEFLDQSKGAPGTVTPSDAADKIAEIRNNKDHPYHSVQAHGHVQAKKRMRELYLIKNNLPVGG